MKNIHNIVASELILRTNNHNLKQEFGEVGISSNIISTGNSTVFTTVFSVHKVNYVTVNGINLIEGVHYEKISDNKISISNSGAPVKKNPSITTTVLVSYYAGHKISFITKVPPVINLFSLNKYSGKNGEIVFNFSISQFDGKNVYWSILKDGSSTPLYSGNTLFTTNGVSNNGTASVKLNHFISPTEYNSRKGQSIPFTFVVIYDLSENGERLDEKLISTAVYKLDTADSITGSLSVSPELIQAANSNNKVTISYQLNRPDTTASFDWAIFKSINGGAEIIIKQGNHASPVLSGSMEESFSTSAGDSFETRYFLRVKDVGAIEYITTLANDKIIVSVPALSLNGRAGYLDALLMSYVDPQDNVMKKIGSLGTAQDKEEYFDRVPSAIFTKVVTKAFLSTNDFINASVNRFENSFGTPTVDAVYFVLEIPDNWGPIDIYQSMGLINMSAFNMIPLDNGYTAYLYNVSPSPATNPSNYYIKAR